MKKLLFLIFSVSLSVSICAQSEIDSLKQLIKENKQEDSLKVKNYNQLASKFLNAYPDTIIYYAEKANKLAKKINFQNGLAESYKHLGTYYFFEGNVKKSLTYLDSAQVAFQNDNNLRGELSVANNRGLVYKNTGNFAKAIENYQEALNGNKKLQDSTGILNNLINLANVNSSMGRYKHTKEYFDEALEVALAIDNESEIANVYSGLGILEERKGNFKKAKELHLKAIDFYKKINFSSNIAITYNNLATIETKKGNYIASIKYFKEALDIAEEIGRKRLQGILLNNIANNYIEIDDLEKAQLYYEQSMEISKSIDQITYYASYTNIGLIKKDLGYYDEAEKIFLESIDFYKSEEITQELVNAYNNISLVYIEKGELNVAEEYVNKALEIAPIEDYDYYLTATYNIYARIESAKDNYEEAIKYALKSYELAKVIESKQRLASSAEILSKSFKFLGNYEKALQYAEIYKEVSDELFDSEKSKELGRIEVESEFNAEKERIQFQNEKILIEKDAKIKERNLFTIISLITLLAMALLSLGLYLFKRKEQKSNAQLRKANEAIEDQNKKLTELHLQKNKLFSIVAHDLRGPLNTLNGMFELAATGNIDDQEMKTLIPEINKQLESTIVLTNNLLEWASQEMREDKNSKENINLHSVVEELKVLFTVSLSNKEIIFNNFIAEKTSILYNKQVLILVLRNLISNAIKYCDQKDKISISGDHLEESNAYQICVADTGIGMEEEVKNNLFQHKVNSVTGTNSESGTGLGLLLSKDFIELQKGCIWVEFSEPNQGTKICFTIPQ